jgi:hypothetical protein
LVGHDVLEVHKELWHGAEMAIRVTVDESVDAVRIWPLEV